MSANDSPSPETTATIPRALAGKLQAALNPLSGFLRKRQSPKAERYLEALRHELRMVLAQPPAESDSWHIWSHRHRAWWRRGDAGRGTGYASDITEAGKWTLAEAKAMMGRCGCEGMIKILPDPYRPDSMVEPDRADFILVGAKDG